MTTPRESTNHAVADGLAGHSVPADEAARLHQVAFAREVRLLELEQEVNAGRFRADLFYRIQGITLNVAPLRERRADVIPLKLV